KTLWFNGVEWPVTWTGVTSWRVSVPLNPGSNQFIIVGVDLKGQPVAGASNSVSVTYNAVTPAPVGQVVINEIMYHPPSSGAEYVELYNGSSTTTFDLSGWELRGLNYTFPAGSMLAPNKYLVLGSNRSGFSAAYGGTIPLFDTFDGLLSTTG